MLQNKSKMSNNLNNPKIKKSFKPLKKIILVILTLFYIYFLLATLNILPRFFNLYRRRPGTIFILTIDPLQNFGAWLVLSFAILAIFGGLFYYFIKKKKQNNSQEKIKIYDLISFIFLYALIFKLIDLIIISFLKLIGFI